jgi:phage terminase large subunit-like protein
VTSTVPAVPAPPPLPVPGPDAELTSAQLEAVQTLANFFGPKVRQMAPGAVDTPLSAAQSRAGRQFTHEDLFDFAASNFYVPETKRPIVLEPVQRCILQCFFDPAFAARWNIEGGFQNYIYSTIKKSGKTTIAALVARWITERWGTMNEVYTVANDLDQSRGLVYDKLFKSLQLDPRWSRDRDEIPGYWDVIRREMTHTPSGSIIKALSGDYRGQAGMNPTATFWSELWGYTREDSLRLWDEMTPVPTRPRSIRWVETYAGFEGESSLLIDQYNMLTKPERGAIHLTRNDVPDWPGLEEHELTLYVNPLAKAIAYWDEGEAARRMPWQTPTYYAAQATNLRPEAYDRLHLNKWVSPTSALLPPEWWDACRVRPDEHLDHFADINPDDAVILAADASVSGDCTGVVAVSRHPTDPTRVLLRRTKLWIPEGKKLNYSITLEPYLRRCLTGHIHPLNQPCESHEYAAELGVCTPVAPQHVLQLCYDQYQLHDMMTRFQNEGLAWVYPFSQGTDRMVADYQLYCLIRDRRFLHFGNEYSLEMRAHVANAGARMAKDDNTKLRIVKKTNEAKIDLVVAAAMATHECLRLNL